jgi:signal transduction histidine kinase
MVEFRASTAASRKLLRIIVSFLMPAVVLGYLLFSAWNHDIAFSRKELDGLEMSRHIFPVLIANSIAGANQTLGTDSLDEILALHHDHEFNPAIQQKLNDIYASNIAASAKVEAIREVFADIGKDSNLLLDPEAEPLFLILVLFQNLPAITKDYHEHKEIIAEALADNSLSPRELTDITLLTGNLLEIVESLDETISLAIESSAEKSGYAALLTSASIINNRIHTIEALLRSSNSIGPSSALQSSLTSLMSSDDLLEKVEKTWTDAADKAQKLIQVRVDRLKRLAYLLGTLGTFSCLLGLVFAVSMFKTTLKRLDDVANAYAIAEAARAEAERLAEVISRSHGVTARLNQDLSESLENLKSAQDVIVKKGRMEQLGHLTATVAHELRNPLATVRTTTFLLNKKLSAKEPELKSQFQRINNSVSRCDDIITKLLDYSNSREIDSSYNDFDGWLATVIEEQAILLPQAVHFECDLGLGQLRVQFDPSQLRRAVINLMSNASEAMVGNGNDPRKFAVSDPIMTVTTGQHGDFVELTIADNGPGVAPELKSKIREPLFTTKSFGTGLGISIAEQIIVRHGGTLEIASTLGKGASFTIRIPSKKIQMEAA